MTTKIADDTASIAQRLKEIEAEKMAQIMGKPLEEPKDEPTKIDWSDVYGYAPVGWGPMMVGDKIYYQYDGKTYVQQWT